MDDHQTNAASTEIVQSETDDRQLELFETRAHGDEMTMAEFASWLDNELGSTGLTKVLQRAAFMLCCDVISQDIAKSTLRLRSRLENGTSEIIHPERHEMAGLLAMKPNRRHTWYEFTEMLVLWHCFTHNAYAGVIRQRDDTPLELIPFQSGRVQEKVAGRDVFYDVTAGTWQEQALLGASMATFHERDMIHVRGRMIDGMDGYSTIVAGRSTLETAREIADFRKRLFAEDGQIRGVFTRERDGVLDEIAFQRLRQQFKTLMTKFRLMTEPIVLEGGLKFDKISSNPEELELAKQFEAQIKEVCRLLRVPPHKVFALDSVKYDNLETLEKSYVGDTLVPIATQFELRFNSTLLSQKDSRRLFFEYDRAEMMIRDTKAETERVMRAVERGIIMMDEARAILGFNPLPNGAGQIRTIPANMNVVDANNKVVVIGDSSKTPASTAPGSDEKE